MHRAEGECNTHGERYCIIQEASYTQTVQYLFNAHLSVQYKI
jgi:hypothetical protein